MDNIDKLEKKLEITNICKEQDLDTPGKSQMDAMADTYDYNTIDIMKMLQTDEIKITDQANSTFKEASLISVKNEEKEMMNQFKEL